MNENHNQELKLTAIPCAAVIVCIFMMTQCAKEYIRHQDNSAPVVESK